MSDERLGRPATVVGVFQRGAAELLDPSEPYPMCFLVWVYHHQRR
jgi:hypothetical protein